MFTDPCTQDLGQLSPVQLLLGYNTELTRCVMNAILYMQLSRYIWTRHSLPLKLPIFNSTLSNFKLTRSFSDFDVLIRSCLLVKQPFPEYNFIRIFSYKPVIVKRIYPLVISHNNIFLSFSLKWSLPLTNPKSDILSKIAPQRRVR